MAKLKDTCTFIQISCDRNVMTNKRHTITHLDRKRLLNLKFVESPIFSVMQYIFGLQQNIFKLKCEVL